MKNSDGGGDQDLEVIIDGGDDVQVIYVMRVISVCRSLGIQDISIAQKQTE